MERKGQFSGWPSTVLGAPDVEKGKLSLVSSAHLLLNSASLLLFFWFFRPFSVDNSRRYFVSFSAFSQSSHADARLWNSWAPFNVVVVLLWNKTNEQLANGRTNRKILSLSFLSFDLFFLFLGRADREIAFSKIECIFDFWCCQSIRVPLPMASSDDIFFWFLFIFLFSITGHEPKYFFLFPHVFVVVPV